MVWVTSMPPVPHSQAFHPDGWSSPAKRPRMPWLPLAALIVSFAASGLVVSLWFRVSQANNVSVPPAQKFTDSQAAESKANICAAFDKAHQAVVVARGRSGGNDPTAQLAVAEGGWVALQSASDYLRLQLAENPAAPAELVDTVRKLAGVFQELSIDYLANVSDAELQPRLRDSDATTSNVERLCK
jgi:hypothetical protein